MRQTRAVTEELVLGGNLSDAVRVGDTVRRRTGPWTPAVHALLRHLEAVGFEGSPRVLGTDEQGREVLAYIEGDGPTGWPDPMPEYVWRDDNLIAAARLLRRYHDAQAGFTPPVPASWRWTSDAREVICHNDVAPFNSVFRDGKLFAMVSKGQVVFKLPKARVDELVEARAGERFDPGHGRLMKEWLALPPDAKVSWTTLGQEALAFVGKAPGAGAAARTGKR